MVGAGFEMSKAISNRYSKTYDQLILFNILLGYLVFVLVTRFKNSGGITSYFGVLFLVVIACAIYTMFSKKKTISNATGTILTLIYPISLFIYMLGINYFESPYRIAGLFFVFVIPCLTDTFAYMIGSLFKGPKLCPSVSPNKTISGAVGGLVGGLLGGAMLLLLVHYLTIGFCGAFFVQVGDLLASYVKRNCGIKDFGKVLPGHGGFMDRVDGMVVFSVFLFIYLNVLSAL